jgi:dCMP deaminase
MSPFIRPTWDEYFIDLAHAAAARSTCPRVFHLGGVGAVLVDDRHHVLGLGYAGSPPGTVHCIDAGCVIENGGCVRTVHAELNALLNARPFDGPKVLYATLSPCWACMKMIAAANVHRVVYATEYREVAKQTQLARDADITLLHIARPWAPARYTSAPPTTNP